MCPDTEDLEQSQDTHFILNSEQLLSEKTGLSSILLTEGEKPSIQQHFHTL